MNTYCNIISFTFILFSDPFNNQRLLHGYGMPRARIGTPTAVPQANTAEGVPIRARGIP